MDAKNNKKKCYNQVSCVLSVFIIAFILGSIIYDTTVSKPNMRASIEEIKQEVQQINQKIDAVGYFPHNDTTSLVIEQEL